MFILKKVGSDCFVKQISHIADINFNSYCDIQYTCDISQVKAKYRTKAEAEEALSFLNKLEWRKVDYEIVNLRKKND